MFKLGNIVYRTLASMGWGAIVPSSQVVKVEKADDEIFEEGACRSLWVGSEGSANLIMPDGSKVEDFPLLVGLNPVAVIGVESGGTADNIWALY